MKTQGTSKRGNRQSQGPADREPARNSYSAYGDKAPICVNGGCLMRKQATCFGFEGCPGFKAKG